MSMSDAAVVSEFITGRRDLCMESSELEMLHCYDPAAYPVTSDALNAIFLRHAARLSQSGQAVTGAETLAQVAQDLDGLGVKYDMLPYQEPMPQDGEGGWHTFLSERVTAGQTYAPVLLQLANGAALGYQPNLQYHGICVFRLASGASPWPHVCGDPASPQAANGQTSTYTLAQLVNARPCGAIAVHLPPPPAPVVPLDLHAVLAQLEAIAAQVSTLQAIVSKALGA